MLKYCQVCMNRKLRVLVFISIRTKYSYSCNHNRSHSPHIIHIHFQVVSLYRLSPLSSMHGVGCTYYIGTGTRSQNIMGLYHRGHWNAPRAWYRVNFLGNGEKQFRWTKRVKKIKHQRYACLRKCDSIFFPRSFKMITKEWNEPNF